MFKTAYFRLTAWYVAIIMAISLAFSVWVYNEATREIRSGLERLRQPAIIGRQLPPLLVQAVEEQLEASRGRIMLNLTYLNLFVFGVGFAGSYVLAKRTMRPIENALESQRRFTADASHELRTPLAAMKTEIEVALRDKNKTEQQVRELLKSTIEEIDRLTALSEDLLYAARDKAVVYEPIALEKSVRTAISHCKPLASKRSIKLQNNIKTSKVIANKHDLEKVLAILLDNAIKYSPPHTVITLESTANKTAVILSVKDQGIGIAPKDLPHIFDRFYRADASRSYADSGHGLGLAIAKKLAQNMGGSLSVKSQLKKGSTFTLHLPLA